ncbi:NAD-dependent histone deacetylase sirtuin-1 [Condylostylus longicornis]|uniref:NAD-dependent histone deacetylase sirtuin-1 n=1 Tax=Condylostylus longicornis TaxID=2530218 RepID=UPI00244E33F1|nr:NAD-dependent histone deacetylase sirtuin-1 [Condylostylus longicornis]
MSESCSSDNPFGSSDSNSSQPLNDSMENSIILTKQSNTDPILNSAQNVYNETIDDDLNFTKLAKVLLNNQIDQQVNHHQSQYSKLTANIDSVANEDDQSDCEECEIEQEECDMDEVEDNDDDDDDEDDDDFMDTDDSSSFSSMSGFTEFFGQGWKAMNWIQCQMTSGANPRDILSQILMKDISPDLDDMNLWKIIASMLTEPPRRQKLNDVNTIGDVVNLLRTSEKIIVLTGAGVSVSCGIPDFRSADGIYARLAKDYPDLPDPQAMFDIQYFSNDPRPFFRFAREIYPGQFTPSLCHRFIKFLEEKGKLLRNYTQNIDTLEQVAGINNVIECHGSFATASCTKCKLKQTANEIRDQIFAQKIPVCPKCQPHVDNELLFVENKQTKSKSIENICDDYDKPDKLTEKGIVLFSESQLENGNGETSNKETLNGRSHNHYRELVQNGIMKPDIVFFGEGLPDAFHSAIADDKDECDLLIVIGSSLKVRPVALIPNLIPPNIPQVLINLEQLPHMDFDVELLGDSDTTISNLCQMLGGEWLEICPKEIRESFITKTHINNENKNELSLDAESSHSVQPNDSIERTEISNKNFEEISTKTKMSNTQPNLPIINSESNQL